MKRQLDRRGFLLQAGSLAAGTVILGLVTPGCSTGLATYRVRRSGETIRLVSHEYPELNEPGGGLELVVEGLEDPIYVVRTSPTSFAAVSPICTHLGCTVRKEPSFFRCPCHGSTYDLEGNVVRGPAQQALQRFPVQIINEVILITPSP